MAVFWFVGPCNLLGAKTQKTAIFNYVPKHITLHKSARIFCINTLSPFALKPVSK
jgi:hypothetical protein